MLKWQNRHFLTVCKQSKRRRAAGVSERALRLFLFKW
nr:MAG TPA: hypothetical protein [Caudoviricetes sp.]